MVAGTGYSWGGGAVAEFCRLDPRSKVAIILDGYFQNVPDLLLQGLFKPFLSIYNAATSDSRLFDKATTNAFWFQISGSVHAEFSAYYWYWTPWAVDAGHEMARTIMAYQVSFLNKYLKDQDDHLLDGPPGSLFPRVINFRKK